MDYILQTEKMFKYLSFNLEATDMRALGKLKKTFNNDLNLIGCYIKDFLTLENDGIISDDEKIYDDFVLCFENYKNQNKEISLINKIIQYGAYYMTLVFEETNDRVLLNTIVSVNSCFNIEYYPFLMELMDKYLNKNIDSISYALMLQSITDTVFKNYENLKPNSICLNSLRKQLDDIVKSRTNKRAAV